MNPTRARARKRRRARRKELAYWTRIIVGTRHQLYMIHSPNPDLSPNELDIIREAIDQWTGSLHPAPLLLPHGYRLERIQ